jgi:response regulator RpfG family c-di-GMP phosphodiesterase
MEEIMKHRILFVDDDEKILRSFNRTLSEEFAVVTAASPEEALHVLEEQGPFPVIVSDMKMPGMSGLELLARSREISPDSVQILLTGFADVETAMHAVNHGGLFRFLTKPCDLETLSSALRDGVRQYRLIVSEKELLEQTLLGTVRVLSQILTLVNPTAQGVTNRLKKYCRHMIKELGLKEKWLYDVAVMLSQLGSLTVPSEILNRFISGRAMSDQEMTMIKQLPTVTVKLLMNIPRLEDAIEIISMQNNPYSEFPAYSSPEDYSKVHLGAQMLHVAIALDCLLMQGIYTAKALHSMGEDTKSFNPALVAAMGTYDFELQNMVQMQVKCGELTTRMILNEDIYSKKGVLLASNGQWVTLPLMMGLLNYSRTVGLNEPFSVLVPILDYEVA